MLSSVCWSVSSRRLLQRFPQPSRNLFAISASVLTPATTPGDKLPQRFVPIVMFSNLPREFCMGNAGRLTSCDIVPIFASLCHKREWGPAISPLSCESSVRLGCHGVGDVDDRNPDTVFVLVFHLISFIRLSILLFFIRMKASLTWSSLYYFPSAIVLHVITIANYIRDDKLYLNDYTNSDIWYIAYSRDKAQLKKVWNRNT